MKPRSSKLIVPIAAILLGFGTLAFYQITRSSRMPSADSSVAATQASMGVTTENQAHPAPAFAMKDVDGKIVHLSDFRGKIVVLNFWATWCPPCRKEIPDFMELQKQYGAGVQFIGVALDEEGLAAVKPYLAAHPISYPTLVPEKISSPDNADSKAIASYGDMTSIPVTFVIDRKGMVRTSYVGMRQKAVLEGLLAPILAEN